MEYYISLFTFSVIAGITPGPNNTLLLGSALNHGVGRSLPLYLGICCGFTFLVAIVGAGVAAIFFKYPGLFFVVKGLGLGYLLYLAWKMAHAGGTQALGELGAPFSFLQGAALQYLNPKAWAIAFGAFALFSLEGRLVFSVANIAVTTFVSSLLCGSVWLLLGHGLRRVLSNSRRVKYFNWAMAVLLVASLLPMLFADCSG